MSMIRFNKKYALYFLGLFVVQILIGAFIKNPAFQENVGNMILVITIYCLLQALFNFNKKWTIFGVGIAAFVFEISKSYDIIEKLNLGDNHTLASLFGSGFNFNNVWSYLVGCAIIYMLEFYNDNTRPKKKKFLRF